MQLLAVGLNHTTAPVSLREQLALAPEHLGDAVQAARGWFARLDSATSSHGEHEAALLSTCNRTEMYAASDVADPVDASARFLADYHRLSYADLRPHLYMLPQPEAVRHAFRVASGLDSMVLGEAADPRPDEGCGARRRPGRRARHLSAPAVPAHASRWPRKCAARPRSARIRCRMAAAAVRLAERMFENVASQSVLFIGAGEMIELCATHFAAHNRGTRSRSPTAPLERGESLAARFSGRAIRLSELPARLHEFDIVDVVRPPRTLPHHRPGRGRTRDQGAPAPADVHGRPGGAARYRAGSRQARRRVPLHRRRPRRRRAKAASRTARPRWRRPKRSSRRACRPSCNGSATAPWCR